MNLRHIASHHEKSSRSVQIPEKKKYKIFYTYFDLQCDKISQTPIINEGWRVGTSQL